MRRTIDEFEVTKATFKIAYPELFYEIYRDGYRLGYTEGKLKKKRDMKSLSVPRQKKDGKKKRGRR